MSDLFYVCHELFTALFLTASLAAYNFLSVQIIKSSRLIWSLDRLAISIPLTVLKYIAASLFAALPTGRYDENQVLYADENQWKWILGGGLIFSMHWPAACDIESARFSADDRRTDQPRGWPRLMEKSYNAPKSTRLSLGVLFFRPGLRTVTSALQPWFQHGIWL